MRSAVSSSAAHCSLYWPSNITCRLLNIGPVTFQWKLWVFRYRVKLSERKRARPSAIFLRSPPPIPISMAGALPVGVSAGLVALPFEAPVFEAPDFDDLFLAMLV